MNKYFAPSELIINEDGSIFHLHVKPEQLADKVILVSPPWHPISTLRSVTSPAASSERLRGHIRESGLQ